MRLIPILAVLILLLSPSFGCSAPAFEEAKKYPMFDSWDQAIAFLQWRHLIPLGDKQKKEVEDHSTIRDIKIDETHFRVIALDWRGESEFGLRGRGNGPFYIFHKSPAQYKLVGGFLGSRVEIIKMLGRIEAFVYYHHSVSNNPLSRYPFIEEAFNLEKIDPNARGDVFK